MLKGRKNKKIRQQTPNGQNSSELNVKCHRMWNFPRQILGVVLPLTPHMHPKLGQPLSAWAVNPSCEGSRVKGRLLSDFSAKSELAYWQSLLSRTLRKTSQHALLIYIAPTDWASPDDVISTTEGAWMWVDHR